MTALCHCEGNNVRWYLHRNFILKWIKGIHTIILLCDWRWKGRKNTKIISFKRLIVRMNSIEKRKMFPSCIVILWSHLNQTNIVHSFKHKGINLDFCTTYNKNDVHSIGHLANSKLPKWTINTCLPSFEIDNNQISKGVYSICVFIKLTIIFVAKGKPTHNKFCHRYQINVYIKIKEWMRRDIKYRRKNVLPNELSAVSSITAKLLLCMVKCRISNARKTKPCNLGRLLWRNFK